MCPEKYLTTLQGMKYCHLVGGRNLAQVEQIFSGIVHVNVCVLNKEQVYLLNTDPLTKKCQSVKQGSWTVLCIQGLFTINMWL